MKKSKVIMMFGLLVLVGLMSSCDSGKKYQINDTQDWIDFVASAPEIKEIDECFMSMTPKQTIYIFEEMVPMLNNLTTTDPKAKAKCRAFLWLNVGVAIHKDRYTNEEFDYMDSYTGYGTARYVCVANLGSDEGNKIIERYGKYYYEGKY